MVKTYLDVIAQNEVKNLSQLFQERIHRSPDKVAYCRFNPATENWESYTWREMGEWVAKWQHALKQEELLFGDRVSIMFRNAPEWVAFEQAALGLGLVIVPLYTNDRAENIGYIIQHADVKVLFIEKQEYWEVIKEAREALSSLRRIISFDKINDSTEPRLVQISDWANTANTTLDKAEFENHELASIVYTSGTTGRPKGVMLSHYNILWNADSSTRCEPFYATDVYLSFLPLSHMLERTVSYYLPMMTGAEVHYARAIETLGEDLITIKPTILVTVPRIFERVYNKIQAQLAIKSPLAQKLFQAAVNIGWRRFEFKQGRAAWHPALLFWPLLDILVARKILNKLGGRMRFSIAGGAPLSTEIARTFIGLGLTILQGYGMTELSPVASTNTPANNRPDGVGIPLPDVEVKLGDNDELLVRCPGVMQGYWRNPEATAETIDPDGWLHTGDKARIEDGHIYITGRIKEIIVLSTGEKIPPADLEMAIMTDSLFEQVLVIGETKPYLAVIAVLNEDLWKDLCQSIGVEASEENLTHPDVKNALLERIAKQLVSFPGYAKVVQVHATLTPWTIEDALITPKLSLKRDRLMEHFSQEIAQMYTGH